MDSTFDLKQKSFLKSLFVQKIQLNLRPLVEGDLSFG